MPRALADSVEAGLSSLPSILPSAATLVAENVLTYPTLRSLSAIELARLLHVRPSDALEAIAAIVGVAAAYGHSPLAPQPSLERAIGPFMSTDTALERFGAHMGAATSIEDPPMRFLHGQYAGALRMQSAGSVGGYGDRSNYSRSGDSMMMMFDNAEYGDDAGAADDPTPPSGDNPPGPSPAPAPAPIAPASPSMGGLTSTTILGIPLLAIVAGAAGIYLLRKKKRRGRR